MDCPDSIYNDPSIRSQYPNHTVVNTTIPDVTLRAFHNNTPGNTIASPMDIQYRNLYLERNKYIDNDEVNARGAFRPLQSLLLDGKYRVVEGLVVDTNLGGIGFRNHTIPIQLESGAQWQEDLLWVIPETACTPVNLSLHFSISENYFFDTTYGYMTDDGGFANLANDIPEPRFDGPKGSWQDAFGSMPDLQQRSYALAWWNNQFTARLLNVSSSSVGTKYTSEFVEYAKLASPSSITISDANGWYLTSVYFNQTTAAKNFTLYGTYLSAFVGY